MSATQQHRDATHDFAFFGFNPEDQSRYYLDQNQISSTQFTRASVWAVTLEFYVPDSVIWDPRPQFPSKSPQNAIIRLGYSTYKWNRFHPVSGHDGLSKPENGRPISPFLTIP